MPRTALRVMAVSPVLWGSGEGSNDLEKRLWPGGLRRSTPLLVCTVTVNEQELAIDVARPVRGQEGNHIGDVLRLAKPPERVQVSAPLLHRRGIIKSLHEGVKAFCFDRTWLHRVDADLGSQLLRQVPRQPVDACLRRGVMRAAAAAGEGSAR